MQSSPFRALGHYRVLPQITGWKSLIVAFAARAPYAMIPLGTMTAVTDATGSVAQGGFATACVALSTAVASPLIGKWSDIRGQYEPLRVLSSLNALALLGLFLAALNGLSGVGLYAVCVGVGITSLPIGSFTRSRWLAQTDVPHHLNAALSYESMADELVFVLGPALVGLAASAAFPSAALFLAFLLVTTAGLAFAASAKRGASSSNLHAKQGPSVGRVLWAVTPSILIMMAIGAFFGATQAATTLRAELAGSPTSAGLVYATMGLGSAIMAILTVAIPERIRLSQRLIIGGLGMALVMGTVALVHSLALTAVLLFLCGLFVGPSMVTAFTVTGRLAPHNGVGIAMTSMQSSVTIGVSLGSGLGGFIAQQVGDTPAYLLPAGAAVIVALVGLGLDVGKRYKNR